MAAAKKDELKKDSLSPLMETLTRNHTKLREDRAKLIESSIDRDLKILIMGIEGKIQEKQSKVISLEDFGPSNTTDLRVGDRDFKSSQWLAEIHQLELDIENLERQLKAALNMSGRYFG